MRLGVGAPDLRVGSASALPWPDGSFDHVFMMWFLEHLRDAGPVLAEARRVLRAGGTITAVETDYTTFKVWPPSEDWDELERAQHEHFEMNGGSCAGRRVGAMLHTAGFGRVRSVPVGFHFFRGQEGAGLAAHVEYIAGFLEPAVPALAGLGYSEAKLRRGVEHLRGLPRMAEGSMTNIVYRASGVR